MKHFNAIWYFILLLTIPVLAQAQISAEQKTVSLQGSSVDVIKLFDEIEIKATPELVWDKVAVEFVHIGDFHSEMDYSYANDKSLRSGLGALRHCQINNKVFIKEKITAWDDVGMSYTYVIYENEDSPYAYRKCTFKVISKTGKTWLAHEMNYKLRGANSKIKKMQRVNRRLLLAYRNYIEREDTSKPRFKDLERHYANALESVRMLEGFANIDF